MLLIFLLILNKFLILIVIFLLLEKFVFSEIYQSFPFLISAFDVILGLGLGYKNSYNFFYMFMFLFFICTFLIHREMILHIESNFLSHGWLVVLVALVVRSF